MYSVQFSHSVVSDSLLLSRFSRVRLCATPETTAHQAPPSLGFSRQEYWSGLPFPPSQAFYAYTKNPVGMIEGLPSPSRRHCIECHQIRSVAQSCPTLCDPMNRSTPGLPVHHQLLEFTQTHVHGVSDAIQPSPPLSSPSPPAPNPSQHQSLFQ